MFPHHQVIVNGCGPVGTSVATLTCGQVRPAKFRLTICEYWIWIPGTRIFFGSEGSFGGDVMANTGVGACDSLGIVGFNSRVPGAVSRGTFTSYATVSIQNLAVMTAAWALGTPAFPSGGRVVMVACVPARKEMFAVPPPFSVASVGPVETSKVMVSLISRPWMARWRTKLGFLMMSVVMVPALMNVWRFCGILGLFVCTASMDWKTPFSLLVMTPIGNGVVSRTANVGPFASPPSAVWA